MFPRAEQGDWVCSVAVTWIKCPAPAIWGKRFLVSRGDVLLACFYLSHAARIAAFWTIRAFFERLRGRDCNKPGAC